MSQEAAVCIAQLDMEEQDQLAAEHPQIRGRETVCIVAGPQPAVTLVAQLLEAWERAGRNQRDLLETLSERMSAGLSEPGLVQIHRVAEARAEYLGSQPMLSSAQVAGLGGSQAKNKGALANRWKRTGKIFAVSSGGADQFPAFQFGPDGRPLPSVAKVIKLFKGEHPWNLALWWNAGSGWLAGRTPREVLPSDPEAVVEAARRTMEPLEV